MKSALFRFSDFLSNSLFLFYLKTASLNLIALNTTSFLTLKFINLYIKISLKDSKYKKDIGESSSNNLLLKES